MSTEAHHVVTFLPTQRFSDTPVFPEAAREALADSQLRTNLKRATTTIRDKRARAVSEVANWDELRTLAATIKDDTLARLPDLLVQFEQQSTAAGATVHWARDAQEAADIVGSICRDHQAQEVIKVKSMAT